MLLSFNFCNYQIAPSRNNRSYSHRHRLCTVSLTSKPRRNFQLPPLSASLEAVSTAGNRVSEVEEESELDFARFEGNESYNFDASLQLSDSKRFDYPAVEVKELEELPEQWRRSRLAWLCKELPAHRSGTIIRLLNAQRKWIKQDDCTYVAVHCMRIRENEAAFRVYKWMRQQHWFQFDFSIATNLADYMGKERKPSKCREIFNDIINQGLVPNESTFHILIVAYLTSNCLEEACTVYNQMIHLGTYKPRLSLHHSLFRALASKTGRSCKNRLEKAEFIFHNLTTCGLQNKIHDDIYGGLIWIHSHQDVVDRERIEWLRAEMSLLGIEESAEVLVSVLRACAKEGALADAEITWKKLPHYSNKKPPFRAFLYMMEVYSRIGEQMKSLHIFRNLQENYPPGVVSYNKIIEIFCLAQRLDLAESLMSEFVDSGLRPTMRSFFNLMHAYFNSGSYDKVGSTFQWCCEKSRPNQTAYNLYLDSLVESGDIDRAEVIFKQMHADEAIDINDRSCNVMLRAYLACDQYAKVKTMYNFMCEKRYKVESSMQEKLEHVLNLSNEEVERTLKVLKLGREQREVLIGLILGGLRFETDEEKRSCAINFVFREDSKIHSFLRRHVHNQFHEWLALEAQGEETPYRFKTVPHSYFKFYADRFFPRGVPVIPKLIHRWLTPRVLAYWYMYGGCTTSSGDVLLRLGFNKEDPLRIFTALKAKFLNFRVKRKGTVLWIGFLGENARVFWEMTRPFVLADVKESLEACSESANALHCTGGDGADLS